MSVRADSYEAGRVVGAGSFICRRCGYRVMLEALDRVPECPSCSGSSFRRASLFEAPERESERPTVAQAIVAPEPGEPGWLAEARARTDEGGCFLALEDEGTVRTIPLREGWTRIGRSAAADIRLDDPTVSRRHALVVRTVEGRVRVLDDRSLNGIFVNGERVEWSPLVDADELAVGRYVLHVLDSSRPGVEPASLLR